MTGHTVRISNTYINELGHVSGLQVPEHSSLVEVGHVRHIVELLHLGRVDLHHFVRLEGLGLPANLDVNHVSLHLITNMSVMN